jgi:lysozyme family protein
MYLRQGSVSPVVTTLQVLLGKTDSDGHFGPKTLERVISYQKMHRPRLKVDGIVGRQTWSALMAENGVVTIDAIDADELVGKDGHTHLGRLSEGACGIVQEARGGVVSSVHNPRPLRFNYKSVTSHFKSNNTTSSGV